MTLLKTFFAASLSVIALGLAGSAEAQSYLYGHTQPYSGGGYTTGRTIASPLCGTNGSCNHSGCVSGGCDVDHGIHQAPSYHENYQAPSDYDAHYRRPAYRYDNSYGRDYRGGNYYGDSAHYGTQPRHSTGHRSRIPLPRSNDSYFDTYRDTYVQPASRTRSRDPFYP